MTKRIRLTKREMNAILRALEFCQNHAMTNEAIESAHVKITQMLERVSKGWRDE